MISFPSLTAASPTLIVHVAIVNMKYFENTTYFISQSSISEPHTLNMNFCDITQTVDMQQMQL